jgi:hypothetical protein
MSGNLPASSGASEVVRGVDEHDGVSVCGREGAGAVVQAV